MFFVVATTLWIGLHAICWRGAGRTKPLLVVSGVLPLLAFAAIRWAGAPAADAVQGLGFFAMGWFSLYVVFRLVTLPARGKVDAERRSFFAAGAASLMGAWGFANTRQLAEVQEVEVKIPALHPDLEGFTIVQLSDVHVGGMIQAPLIEQIAARVNGLDADLVAITGDLVDGSVANLAPHVAPLAALKSRYGTWFCTGNHEYYSGAIPWVEHLRTLGWKVLVDQHLPLAVGAATLVVAGVADASASRMEPSHRSDPFKALEGAPEADFRLLLAHQPRSVHDAAAAGFDLQLSGHTHAGQYAPFTLLIHLFQEYVAGLHQVGKTWLYVNRGTTWWGPPIRLGSPQEITRLVLRRA